jgi:hypothetical protein
LTPFRRLASGPAVFLLALALRLGYLFWFDDPMHRTEYSYLQGGLAIASHETPWRFVWTTEVWREWGDRWVVAPLYYLFLAGTFLLFGTQIRTVQVLQCGLDAVTAILVGVIGRRLEPRYGAWAGLAYALYWPAVSLPPQLLSENLHTVLLVGGVALLLRNANAADGPGTRRIWLFLGGALLGLSALARAVSLLFVPVAGLWRWAKGPDRRWGNALLVVAGAAAIVLPWSLRNAFIIGDPVPIETLAYYNLYKVNSFVPPSRYEWREEMIHNAPTPQARRALAVRYAWKGVRTQPRQFLSKIAANTLHFLRPEGLHLLFVAEWARPLAWHVGNVLLGDGLLVPAAFLFVAFLVAGPPSPGRALLGLWTLYYLFFVLVVYNSTVRYRTALAPLVLAGMPAGVMAIAASTGKRRALGLVLGAAVAAAMLVPHVEIVARGSLAFLRGLGARVAFDRGEVVSAARAVRRAAEVAPRSVNPLLRHARFQAERGDLEGALATYDEARSRKPAHVVAHLASAPLLQQLGRMDRALLARQGADDLLKGTESRQLLVHVLSAAWLWLAPPVTDELEFGRDAYGAADNLVFDLSGRSWTRHEARVRLRPRTRADNYDVTIEMSSPLPSPLTAPRVVVAGPNGEEAIFTLERDARPYSLRIKRPADGIVRLSITAPSWTRRHQPPDQGVCLTRVRVVPAAPH